MELRQLEYFQMASRLRNITRAAERLRVSQPNITVAIKKLEAELGIQLFDRSQKQLALTPEGAVFLNRVELALRNIQDAVLEVNDYKQLQKGTIKIGVPPMMGAYLFPRGGDWNYYRDNYEIYDPNLNANVHNWVNTSLEQFDNPYWILNRQKPISERNRYEFGGQVRYDIIEGLSVTGRITAPTVRQLK